MSDYDVIIIGAGIGGLTCGALLAKHGMNVLICEQHDKPGGYCTSYKRGGYRFDVPHVMSGMRKGAFLERLLHYLTVDGLVEFEESERSFRLAYPDLGVNCYTDIGRFQDELNRAFPSSGYEIKSLLAIQQQVYDAIVAASGYAQPRPLRYSDHLTLATSQSYRTFLRSIVHDERLRCLLEGGWAYVGGHPDAISAVSVITMYMMFHSTGAWRPRRGFGSLTAALAGVFSSAGGTISLRSRVGRILSDRDAVVGVQVDDGDTLTAPCIVSNADTRETYARLAGHISVLDDLREKVAMTPLTISGVSVNLAVDIELPEDVRAGCTLYGSDVNSTDRAFEATSTTDGSSSAPAAFALNVVTEPEARPVGSRGGIVSIDCAPVAHKPWAALMTSDYRAYKRRKDVLADRLIAAAETLLPNLSRHIITKDVSTPTTYSRYTGASEGSWWDLARLPSDSELRVQVARPPIRGLLMTGAKGHSGAGIAGAFLGGFQTADAILGRKLSREGVLWK